MSKPFNPKRMLSLFSLVLIIIALSSATVFSPRITEKKEGCTSWIAIGNALQGSNNILHKTRDMTDDQPMVAREISNGLYRYLGFSSYNENPDNVYVWGGINETGLSAASNYVGGIKLDGKYGGPSVCREILERCASVNEAYDWLTANKNSFSSGNIIFLADKQNGAVVEVKVNLFSASISSLDDSIFDGTSVTVTGKTDINFRSNHYKILSNYTDINPGSTSYDRYERLINLLTLKPEEAATGYYGNVNVENCQAISLLRSDEGTENAICRESTKGRMTFEIDETHPLNSILWYGDGYPCSEGYESYTFSENEIISYDFSGITGDDNDFNIFECDIDMFPFNGNTSYRNDKDEPTDNEYISISLPNSTRWSSDDPKNYDEIILWVEMTINEHPSDIKQIEFVFQGNSSQNNDFEIYVKKTGLNWVDNESWVKAGTSKRILSGDDDVIRRVLDTNIDLFIDNSGMITWIVGTPEGHSDSINTNYVKMDVVMSDI